MINKKFYIPVIVVLLLLLIMLYYFDRSSKSDAIQEQPFSPKTKAIYITSSLNNRKYLVQNLENKEDATYILSVVHERIMLFKNYLANNINQYPYFSQYIKQFCGRIKNLDIYENTPNGKFTSFTVNKGEEIALCLRSKVTGELHDINLIMYVVLHELAHVACPEVDHTDLFKKIFIFFLEVAIFIKIYEKVNYQIDPHEYCGLPIRENLLK